MKLLSWPRLAAALALLAALALGTAFGVRIDLSRDRFYTPKARSLEIVRGLEGQALVRYYVSDILARSYPAVSEMEAQLRSFAARSGGRLRLEIVDPETLKDSGTMARLGIQGWPMETGTTGGVQRTVYSGISVEYLDRHAVIPLILGTEYLEYDLVNRLDALEKNRMRTIGILVASRDKDYAKDFPLAVAALQDAGFEVRELPADSARLEAELANPPDALFVFGGASELSLDSLKLIDRYVATGGGALFSTEAVTVDSYTSDLTSQAVGPDAPLLDVLRFYGVEVRRELALDEASLMLSSGGAADGADASVVPYPFWIALLRENADRAHPLSSRSGGLDLFWASPLRPCVASSGEQATVLFWTTPNAWRMTRDFTVLLSSASQFENERAATSGAIPLVVSLEGAIPSYFGLPRPAGKASRVLVAGDSDFATTLIRYSGSELNLNFLLLAADWLSGRDDLLSLRHAPAQARLDRIVDPKEKARAMLMAERVALFFVPLAIMGIGLALRWRRRHGRP